MCVLALLAACATPYKQAKKATSNGYFDTKLQEGMYEVLFNGNENTSTGQANNYALLRAAIAWPLGLGLTALICVYFITKMKKGS